ncbi:ribonuclease D [Nocardioides terrisoli]|uniref:ribonuclease D n=1 Tax=Nocardioides terrisoli TaxID=3388267 RepID=UPI00287BAE61|nr:HRDC domain-containing protein [Nocardioides marmorisolisilvae]
MSSEAGSEVGSAVGSGAGAPSEDHPPGDAGMQPQAQPETPPEPAPLLRLRDGLPAVVDTPDALHDAVRRLADGSGPVALDAERASGYRYSARAYLIQLRRQGSGTFLIDPIAFVDLAEVNEAIGDAEWILHAATQDLACLREVGLRPTTLFDTEHAARLLGYPRVGLATLVETILGQSMRKEHSAVDWSRRPLPEAWLEYAALDVEVLRELRDVLAAELEAAGKARWAAEEFQYLVGFTPAVRQEPWRRTSGIHKVKNRRALAAVRELWSERDGIAAERDVTPGRLVPDAALIAAARAMPTDRGALLGTDGFHGRGARRYADRWVAAIARARDLPEGELPPVNQRPDGPPQARSWADRDPVAAARLAKARAALAAMSETEQVPVENLLTPDYMRRVLWAPPEGTGAQLVERVGDRLTELGARPWQVELTAPILVDAIEHPDVPAAEAERTDPED